MSKECPKCKSDGFVEEYCSILFTLMDWRTVTAFMLVVGTFGHIIGFSMREVVICSAVTAIPLCIRILRKGYCERCDIEFNSSSAVRPDKTVPRPH